MSCSIGGVRISLRTSTMADAPFLHGLRSDPRYNRYLSPVTTLEAQRRWLEDYKVREAAGLEYYFIIEDTARHECGCVRLYQIGDDQFCWGSFVLNHDKPYMAALDSAVASFGFGFEQLGCRYARFEAMLGNEHAIRFYRRLGVPIVGKDDASLYFEYRADQFFHDRPKWLEILQAQP